MKNGTPGISRADSWLEKGRELGRNSSCEEAVKAFDKAIELEPLLPMPEPRSLGIRNKPSQSFFKIDGKDFPRKLAHLEKCHGPGFWTGI